MSFFTWIIQTILDWLTIIYWKKALWVSKISQQMFAFYAKVFGFIFLIIFSFLGLINYSIFLDVKTILIMFFLTFLLTFAFIIRQTLYTENKISQLIPFENLNKLFSIIAGFLLYKNANFWSFIIALLAVIVVIIFNIDWNKFTLPKNLWKIFFVQACFSINILLVAYILKTYSSIDVSMLEIVVWTIIIMVFFIKFSELKKIHKQSKIFYKYRFIAAGLGWLAYIVWLFLLKNIWVVLSILLWFLWMGVTLLMSYVYFNDKPQKKDILLSIILLFFIALGFYFNY